MIQEKQTCPVEEILKQAPELKSLSQEDQIPLNLTELSEKKGNEEIKNCEMFLKKNGTPFGKKDYVIEIIKGEFQTFLKLFQEATELANSKSDYITGLKIHFGMDANNKMQVLYQPVGLKRKKNVSEETYDYNVLPSSNYYHYNAKKEEFIIETITSAPENYKKKISIQHDLGKQHEPFISGVDVEAVIFPFQEIFTLIYFNKPIIGKDIVAVFNSIRKQSSAKNRIKHTIILGPKGVGPLLVAGTYANLGNLCPPCTVTYTG